MPDSTLRLIKRLSPHLFWDIDKEQFDAERNSAQLIGRVLECGELSDWCAVRDYYGLDRIAHDCKTLRHPPPRGPLIHLRHDRYQERGLQMLHLQTVTPNTLELLRELSLI